MSQSIHIPYTLPSVSLQAWTHIYIYIACLVLLCSLWITQIQINFTWCTHVQTHTYCNCTPALTHKHTLSNSLSAERTVAFQWTIFLLIHLRDELLNLKCEPTASHTISVSFAFRHTHKHTHTHTHMLRLSLTYSQALQTISPSHAQDAWRYFYFFMFVLLDLFRVCQLLPCGQFNVRGNVMRTRTVMAQRLNSMLMAIQLSV